MISANVDDTGKNPEKKGEAEKSDKQDFVH